MDNEKRFPLAPIETPSRASATATEEELQAAIDRVPCEYAKFIPIMTTEVSQELPKHFVYDNAINFKDGTIPPWGRI